MSPCRLIALSFVVLVSAAFSLCAGVGSASAATAGYSLMNLGSLPQVSCDPVILNFSLNTQATDLNDAGQVTGDSVYFCNDSSFEAFLWSAGSMNGLGFIGGFAGGWDSSGKAINDLGTVVGASSIAPGVAKPTHPFLYANGVMADLGSLADESQCSPDPCISGVAEDINHAGDVVGTSPFSLNPVAMHAFLYHQGTLFDLNSLISADSGWVLSDANRINNEGNIYGIGTLNGANANFIYRNGTIRQGQPPVETNSWGQYVTGNTIVNKDGSTHNIASLLPANSPWVRFGVSAVKINSRGQIIGNGAGDPPNSFTVVVKTPYLLSDNEAPSCTASAELNAKSVNLVAQDSLGGLATIVRLAGSTAAVTIPSFAGGTWNPVTARGIAPAVGSALARLGATDIAGNTTECPPAALIGQRSTLSQDIRIDRINGTSHQFEIRNGQPGLTKLTIVANGTTFQSVNLTNGATVTINLAAALQAGTNTLTLISLGPAGSHAVAIVR